MKNKIVLAALSAILCGAYVNARSQAPVMNSNVPANTMTQRPAVVKAAAQTNQQPAAAPVKKKHGIKRHYVYDHPINEYIKR